jgi:hypothetical protein
MLAPGLKTIESTPTPADGEMEVMFDVSKVATSVGALGTVAGVQFAAVFQSPLVGLVFQVALPAQAGCDSNVVRIASKIRSARRGEKRPME